MQLLSAKPVTSTPDGSSNNLELPIDYRRQAEPWEVPAKAVLRACGTSLQPTQKR